MTKTKTARRYVIHGRVQGVGFRYFTERVATELGIAGSVKNRWDGAVEVYAVGDAASLDALKVELAKGPRSANVTRMEESDEPVRGHASRFRIEDGW